MSSIIRTIDALKEIHVGDYVEFLNGRLGYVDEIIPPDNIRIVEDDGSLTSSRSRRFTVKKHKVAVVPKSGSSFTNNRTLIQPPEPYKATNRIDSENFPDETKKLIKVLKETKNWTNNSISNKHPFFNYLQANDHREEGWIRNFLPCNTI